MRILLLTLALASACQTKAVVVQRTECAKRCTGCCDATGVCLTGEADDACGAPGAACRACDRTETCSERACAARSEGVVDAGPALDAGTTGDAGASPHDAGTVDAGVGCSDGWCLDGLTPTGAPITNAHLRSVWARTGSDVWAVGDQGTALHYDGTNWHPTSTGVTDDLFGVWAASASDAWAVGGSGDPSMDLGVLLHFDGTGWTAVKRGIKRIDTVWGSGPSDVWFGGTLGTILHWDGSAVTPVASPTTESIAQIRGLGNRAWAVGSSGLVLEWSGTAWTRAPVTMANGLTSVLPLGPSLTWVAGGNGAFATWDGSRWQTLSIGDVTAMGMWGTRTDWVWSVGPAGELQFFNGVFPSKKTAPTTNFLRDVHGASEHEVWAVGFLGTILRYR